MHEILRSNFHLKPNQKKKIMTTINIVCHNFMFPCFYHPLFPHMVGQSDGPFRWMIGTLVGPRMSFIILKKRIFLYLKWNFPMTLSDRRKVGRTILWLVGPMVVRSVGISVGWYVIISSFNYHASVGALFNFKHGRSCNETIMISSLCWPNPWRFWSLVSLQPLHWFYV